jgi:hypothetical protein
MFTSLKNGNSEVDPESEYDESSEEDNESSEEDNESSEEDNESSEELDPRVLEQITRSLMIARMFADQAEEDDKTYRENEEDPIYEIDNFLAGLGRTLSKKHSMKKRPKKHSMKKRPKKHSMKKRKTHCRK